MHIAEGYLPLGHALGWSVVSFPVVGYGLRQLQRRITAHPEQRLLLGAAGAFAFVLSALKLPSFTGSSSHPTGTGLGAALFGPSSMAVLGTLVLVFQALLLAHGGLSTLGANAFSMAIVGPGVAYGVFWGMRRAGLSAGPAAGVGAALGNLSTYAVTALQLGLAFPDAEGGVWGSFAKFAGIFALTQLPLAVVEGILTSLVLRALVSHFADELRAFAAPAEVP